MKIYPNVYPLTPICCVSRGMIKIPMFFCCWYLYLDYVVQSFLSKRYEIGFHIFSLLVMLALPHDSLIQTLGPFLALSPAIHDTP